MCDNTYNSDALLKCHGDLHWRLTLCLLCRFLPLEAPEKRFKLSQKASNTSHVLCIDFDGTYFETERFEHQLKQLVTGIQVSLSGF